MTQSTRKFTKVFHIGRRPLQAEMLNDNFKYKWVPSDYDLVADQLLLKIFKEDDLNPKMLRSVFILARDAKILHGHDELLVKLPAHQIIYEKGAIVSSEAQRILDLKGAKAFDFQTEHAELFQFINEQFTNFQEGYKSEPDYIKIHKNFRGKVLKQGECFTELTGEFGKNFQQTLTWKMTSNVLKGERFEIYPEFEVVSGDVKLLFKLTLIESGGRNIAKKYEITGEEVKKNKRFVIEGDIKHSILGISLYVKGNGQLRIGQLHIRRALTEGNVMIPGGRRLIDYQGVNQELLYYFNAGDLKPPLSVYFAGYRTAEGFEGRNMMTAMKSPFLLVADPRLLGGAFYWMNPELEQRLIGVILETLDLLGFKKSDLILSGMSMGSYASMSLSSDLSPHAVIVGKPIINVETIIMNEKVIRPNVFPAGYDMLYNVAGEISVEATRKLDQIFWEKISKGNYSDTTFVFSYMKNDDYDTQAFPRSFRVIKEKDPRTKILHKGFVGRHNDNTDGIINWFIKQYQNILVHDFNRKPIEVDF